jgi:hypothetical protein
MKRNSFITGFRSFLDRLYMLQRFKLFMGARAIPFSSPVQSQNLRLQLVALVQKYRRSDAVAPNSTLGDAGDLKSQWNLCVQKSTIPNAGDGVFLRGSAVPAGTLLTLYPGNFAAL